VVNKVGFDMFEMLRDYSWSSEILKINFEVISRRCPTLIIFISLLLTLSAIPESIISPLYRSSNFHVNLIERFESHSQYFFSSGVETP